MLTGKRPFDGEDVSDTLANVLKREPDWTALRSDVPPAIRTLLQQLSRQGSPASGGRHLNRAVRAGESREPRGASRHGIGRAAAPQTAVAARRHAGGRGACDMPPSSRRARSGSPCARLTGAASCLASADRSVGCRRADHQRHERDLAITPDGSRVDLCGQPRHAALRPRARRPRAGGGVHRRAARAVRLPRWPMDRVRGRHAVLKKVAVTGGPAVTLATLDGVPRGATWAPDDTIIVATNNGRPACSGSRRRAGRRRSSRGPTARRAKPITCGRSCCRAAAPCCSRSRR